MAFQRSFYERILRTLLYESLMAFLVQRFLRIGIKKKTPQNSLTISLSFLLERYVVLDIVMLEFPPLNQGQQTHRQTTDKFYQETFSSCKRRLLWNESLHKRSFHMENLVIKLTRCIVRRIDKILDPWKYFWLFPGFLFGEKQPSGIA